VPINAISRSMVKIKAVLWDMDGVLVDNGELHYQAWLETLSALSIPFDRDKFRQTFGMNNAGILTVLMGKPPDADFLEMVSNRKENLFRQLIHGYLHLLPGALEWLMQLSERGILQAVASSAPKENIDVIVQELSIRIYFSALVSGYSLPGKPDPAVFLEVSRRLGTEPKQCVVVEDALAGIAAAMNAGMKCIAVSTTHPKSSLSAADVIVDSLQELTLNAFLEI
jgi:HAD superfamily hydrolase (TIGR01509 family)